MDRARNALKDLLKTPEQKAYGLVAATALTVVFFAFFAIRPAYLKILELNRDIRGKEYILAEMQEKQSNLVYLRDQKTNIEDQLENFETALPLEQESGFLIANFAALAENNNIVLSSVQFRNELDRSVDEQYQSYLHYGSISFLQVQLEVSGDIDDIFGYLQELEEFPRPIDVKSFDYTRNTVIDTISNSEEDATFYPYSGSFRVVVFYSNVENISDTLYDEPLSSDDVQ